MFKDVEDGLAQLRFVPTNQMPETNWDPLPPSIDHDADAMRYMFMQSFRTGQSRRGSMIEACLNTGIGMIISLCLQLIVFPLFGIHIPLSSDVAILSIFTVASVIRSYVLRRYFNSLFRRMIDRIS